MARSMSTSPHAASVATDDSGQLVVDTGNLDLDSPAERPGVTGRTIHESARECVRIECWAPDARVEIASHEGLEIFCLEGDFHEGGETFARGSWLRLPASACLAARAGRSGCRLWIKTGHLGQPVSVP
jgi:hypothetical protein